MSLEEMLGEVLPVTDVVGKVTEYRRELTEEEKLLVMDAIAKNKFQNVRIIPSIYTVFLLPSSHATGELKDNTVRAASLSDGNYLFDISLGGDNNFPLKVVLSSDEIMELADVIKDGRQESFVGEESGLRFGKSLYGASSSSSGMDNSLTTIDASRVKDFLVNTGGININARVTIEREAYVVIDFRVVQLAASGDHEQKTAVTRAQKEKTKEMLTQMGLSEGVQYLKGFPFITVPISTVQRSTYANAFAVQPSPPAHNKKMS